MRLFLTQYGHPRLAKYAHNSLISSLTQRRHFVKPRTKVRDPLDSAPSVTLDYSSITETKGLEDDGYSQKKLTFIHRPPPTAPSPHSIINAPASPLLRPATPHKHIFKGVVKLRPGESPVVIGGHKQTKSSEAESETDSGEPPLLRSYPHIRRRHLGEEDLAKMRTLRETNPQVYTRQRLAKMFDCSPVFVSMAAPLPREALKEVWREKLEQKEGWTWRKQLVREMRKKRRELW
jgi:Mitochondrial ribosomal protein subunit L20